MYRVWFCFIAQGDAVAEDEVVGEIETDKVRAKFKLHLKYNPTISYGDQYPFLLICAWFVSIFF